MDAQFEYVEGQGRPGFPALLNDYQQVSDEVSGSPGAELDVHYGSHERQRFDHFPAAAPAVGVLLYLHAGYWQSRDKSQFRLLAPSFQQRGIHFVAVNYPLCPQVSLSELVTAVRPCVAAVRRHLAEQGVVNLPLAISGHSAGGHLAVELTLAGIDPMSQVQGVWGISGVYDPRPLVQTTLNHKLGLTDATAAEANVISRVRPVHVPGLWVVGGAETSAFIQQNTQMHEAWLQAGHDSACVEVPQADHFTVLQACMQQHGPVHTAFDAWWSRVLQRAVFAGA